MNIILYAIPAFILLIAVELFINWQRQRDYYASKDTIACLAMGLGNVAITAVIKTSIVGLWFLLYEYRLFDLPVNAWWVWALLIVCEDFCYYWFHRAHHESRLGWAAHVNHHSSQRYNLAVALRQSWTTPITGILFWLPLPLLGFHPAMVLIGQAISLLYQFWIHTQTIGHLGPLELAFNTPSHHRVHHGANPQYIDKNYGGILIIWDRLFGSFAPEQEAVRYGLTKNLTSHNPIVIAFHEWAALLKDVRQANNWRERLNYSLRRPGWRADVRSQTKSQARQQ